MLVWAVAATTVASFASATFPLGFHFMVDGALEHDGAGVVFGACVVAVLFTLAWTLSTMSAGRTPRSPTVSAPFSCSASRTWSTRCPASNTSNAPTC
jgi:ABC-type proline/glycine betaine transport system permease subunit